MSRGRIVEELDMKAIRGVFEDGRLSLNEEAPEKGPVEVLVVFPNGEEDPWERILNDTRRRPALDKFMQECMEEIKQGKAKPLNLDDL
jgi:hypothetical protein